MSMKTNVAERAAGGSFEAMEELIKTHESWIFNLALRMTGNTQEAEDATQEILMKMVTRLSTFENKSEFKTWLYRIAKNHILNMGRSPRERFFLSFDDHKAFLQKSDFASQSGKVSSEPEEELLVGFVKNECLTGMLLCLDREQRFIFILAFIFGVSVKTGSEILEISHDSFKQRLHRARTQLRNYMEDRCGLIDRRNSCSCARKVKKAIESGFVDPSTGLFSRTHVAKIKDLVRQRSSVFETKSTKKFRELFLQGPFMESKKVQLLTSKAILNLRSGKG
jgi:RNA polymerase sigma factor (sigma-70 family)